MFANTKVQVASRITPAATRRSLQIAGFVARIFEIAHRFKRCPGGRIQIGRATDQRGEFLNDRVQYFARRGAGCHAFRISRKDRDVGVPAIQAIRQPCSVEIP